MKHFVVLEFCLYSAILEFVSLANVIWYKCQEPSTYGMMLNHVICMLLNTKEVHKMVAPIKIKIKMFQLSVRLCHWLFKNI
jgi:hypothetical protein